MGEDRNDTSSNEKYFAFNENDSYEFFNLFPKNGAIIEDESHQILNDQDFNLSSIYFNNN